MKKILTLFCWLAIGNFVFAQQLPSEKYQLLKADNIVQSKNYYLLTLLRQLPKVNKLISEDVALSQITAEKLKQLSATLSDCKNNNGCYVDRIKFSEQEIKLIGERLKALYSSQKELKNLVLNDLIPSGRYILYADLKPEEMLVKAWEQDAHAVNYAIEVYADGRAPNSPKIDSISFNVKDKNYPILLYDINNTILNTDKDAKLFFKPSMDYALLALTINDRDRAADFEPMEKGCNRAAFEAVSNINWKNYPYSLILVPGAGPDDPNEPLSAIGILRCRVAAQRWQEDKAPFIMVSGGKVHPYKTKYCEAEEMKKYLEEKLHVPESAIIMEPHARHTTTNMRNCARLMFRYGMPMDKPAITSTTKSQSYYITNDVMQKRCIKELGYSPYKNGKRVSETEAEFFPVLISLQIDADEPMDP